MALGCLRFKVATKHRKYQCFHVFSAPPIFKSGLKPVYWDGFKLCTLQSGHKAPWIPLIPVFPGLRQIPCYLSFTPSSLKFGYFWWNLVYSLFLAVFFLCHCRTCRTYTISNAHTTVSVAGGIQHCTHAPSSTLKGMRRLRRWFRPLQSRDSRLAGGLLVLFFSHPLLDLTWPLRGSGSILPGRMFTRLLNASASEGAGTIHPDDAKICWTHSFWIPRTAWTFVHQKEHASKNTSSTMTTEQRRVDGRTPRPAQNRTLANHSQTVSFRGRRQESHRFRSWIGWGAGDVLHTQVVFQSGGPLWLVHLVDNLTVCAVNDHMCPGPLLRCFFWGGKVRISWG